MMSFVNDIVCQKKGNMKVYLMVEKHVLRFEDHSAHSRWENVKNFLSEASVNKPLGQTYCD